MQKVRLGDVGTIITGNTPKTSEKNNYSSKDICFVKPSDILEDEITIIENCEFYISEYARNKSRILPINSVLVTCIGIIGKVAINKKECAFNQQINAIIPDTSKCLPQYLAYAIQFNKRKMQDIANAPVVPIMNKAQFSDVIIKLLSIEQQKRIADELDKITHLITLRKRQLSKLDELVKSRFVEMFGDPIENPMNWPMAKMGDYLKFLTSGSRGWAKYYSDDGELFITIKNVKDGKISIDNVQHVQPPTGAESERTRVQEGDLLISITADLGRTGIVTRDIVNQGAYINQHLSCIRLDRKSVEPLFVALYLESSAGKAQFERKNQSAVKAGLNFAAIRSLQFPLPPLALQWEFAAFVEKVDKLALKAKASLDKLETLKQAQMQKYFG